MGFGSSLKKAAKSVGKSVKKAVKDTGGEYDRWTTSKLGAYATPYLSLYDSDGRDALVKNWGGYAAAGAGVANPAAGAALGAGVQAYTAYNAPDPRTGGSGFAAPVPLAPVPTTPDETGDNRAWLIAGGAVAFVVVAVVLVLILKKKAR
jgi:hypothetical protein